VEKPVIRFDKVSKRFSLHQERPRSFKELLLSRFRPPESVDETADFWALKEVSFDVMAGEVVGLIGSNGAGKSTALKLMARIIDPTSGNIEVSGRVRALLEVGTGFHPDLTGRENIYLNGSIFGLSREEINRKLDEIVAFSELERFIDVPVKHYSSGMYVRLGFSVAVHTDPEVLLVDEVLAVGDVNFQRKCLERVNYLRSTGVTIFFVSHSAETVRTLCSRAIWVDGGVVVGDGPSDGVVRRYLGQSWATGQTAVRPDFVVDEHRWGNRRVEITGVRLLNKNNQPQDVFVTGEPWVLEILYQTDERIEQPVFGMAIYRDDGVHVTGPNTLTGGCEIPWIEGSGVLRYEAPSLPMLGGVYYISVAVHNHSDTEMYDYHDRLYPFRIMPGEERFGVITLEGEWSRS